MAKEEVKVEEKTEPKVYTQEEVDRDYVKRSDFDKTMREYQKVVDAFNKLMTEYNQLHLKMLLNSQD